MSSLARLERLARNSWPRRPTWPSVLLQPGDPAYPVRLRNLKKPPALTTSGPLDTFRRSVAIVGSRAPVKEAAAFAGDLAAKLARANVLVISGGAVGIDATAHEAALEHGATWCVAPNGRGRPYPPENVALFERIAASTRSRMLWPFPDGFTKTEASPIQRNEILVALAHVVVVIQAHFKSGSRNAITTAWRMRRPLFIVPAAPWMPRFAGSSYELSRGRARMLAHPSQLFRYLGIAWPGPHDAWTEAVQQQPGSPILDDVEDPETTPDQRRWTNEERTVFSMLSGTPKHIDEVVARTGLQASPTITALLTLSLKDVVVESPDGFFRRR